MSVDTVEEAKKLQTLCGSLSIDGERYLINRSSGFRTAEVDSMDIAGEWLEGMYQKINANGKAAK